MTIHVGDKFGKLSVIGLYCLISTHRLYASCGCECGKLVECYWQNLVHGRTKSCGCWRKTSEPYLASRHRKSFGYAAMVQLYNAYRSNAKRRQNSFSLTLEVFRKLTSSSCAYCGSLPSQINRLSKSANGYYTYNGVDRVDNSIGYEEANVVAACGCCNRAKGTMPRQKFVEWAKKVAQFCS
jgi:5-methylcytosine-specific restriction endonuclease McrA